MLAYPGLPPSWQQAVERELERGGGGRPATGRNPLSDCGQEMVFASPTDLSRYSPQTSGAPTQGAGALETHLEGQLIESAEQAINVWDFERVAHANNLPEHWAYIHMGVDDSRRGRRTERASSAHASPQATRSGYDQVGHVGPAIRSPMEHPALSLSGRGPRGVSHAGRERGRQSGSGKRRSSDPVASEFAVVRGHRCGPGRSSRRLTSA